MAKNLSLVLHPSLTLTIEERPVPIIQPEEVLLNIRCTGICGTDLHMWSHGVAGMVKVNKPMVLGHESSGVVVQVGERVKHLKIGDRVCVEPLISCGQCKFCVRGLYNHCPDLVVRGYPVDGMCTTLYSHPARLVYKLPDNVSFEEGAMVEPLSVAVSSCERAGVKAGQNVLICGAGPVGVMTMLCAKAMGVNSVSITDVLKHRLDLAKTLGADHVILVKRDVELRKQVQEILGDLADVTIDCCGSSESVPAAITATRTAGVVTIVGMGGEQANIPLNDIVTREVDLRGVFTYPNCFPTALSLLETGSVKLHALMTHKFKQGEAEDAFKVLSEPNSGAMKVMIQVSE